MPASIAAIILAATPMRPWETRVFHEPLGFSDADVCTLIAMLFGLGVGFAGRPKSLGGLVLCGVVSFMLDLLIAQGGNLFAGPIFACFG